MAVPAFLQSALWSYAVRTLNPQRDKHYIITQILNHGTWEQLQWLRKTYSVREIRAIVTKPSRGVWHRDVLNFWEMVLKVKIPKARRVRAILDLTPKFLPLPHVQRTSRHTH